MVTKRRLAWMCALCLFQGLIWGYFIGTLIWRIWRWQ